MRVVLTGNTCFKLANFREGLIRALLARGWEVLILAPADGNQEKLEAMGCIVHDLPMDRNGTSPFAEAALLWHIFWFLMRERPSMVFGYTIKNNIYSGLACLWLGIPFVANVTGLGPAFNGSGPLNRIVRLLYRASFTKAQAVFFQNTADREVFLKARLIKAVRAKLLPGSGVDLERFKACSLPSDAQGVVFLLIARLLWDKGIGIYADAARVLRAENPSLRFQVIGPPDPDSRSAIPMAQLAAWVKEESIEYLGQMEDVRPAMERAHCVVLPTWYREGTPRVLLEAAAMARPVITTNTPGCRDAVEDGRTGLLCEPQDLNDLINVMTRYAGMSAGERKDMGAKARALAVTEFSEAKVIEAYLEQLPR